MEKNEMQIKAFEQLKSLYSSYPLKPKRYGFTERVLENSKQYDVPGRLLNWKKDRRQTTIPDYSVKIEETNEKPL